MCHFWRRAVTRKPVAHQNSERSTVAACDVCARGQDRNRVASINAVLKNSRNSIHNLLRWIRQYCDKKQNNLREGERET